MNKALYLEQLKRFWAIPVLMLLAYIVFAIIPLLSAINDAAVMTPASLMSMHGWGFTFTEDIALMSSILSMRHFPVLVIAVGAPLLVVFCVMGMFFNTKSNAFYYALPMNKRQLITTNALAGITLLLIPAIVFAIILWAIPLTTPTEINNIRWWSFAGFDHNQQGIMPTIFGVTVIEHGEVMNTLHIVLGFLIRLTIIKIFYFAVFWLAFSLAGNGIVGILISGLLPLIPVLITGLIQLIFNYYVFGFIMNMNVSRILYLSNPATWGIWIQSARFNDATYLIIIFIVYALLTLAALAAAFFVSCIRKPERTGDSVVFLPVKKVLIFIVALTCMILLGGIMNLSIPTAWSMYLGFVLGFIIGYIIAQMIAEKTLNILYQLKYIVVYGGTALALFLIMLVFTQFGMNFFTQQIPHHDEVMGVYLSTDQYWRFRVSEPNQSGDALWITDPAIITQTLLMHQTILDNQRTLRPLQNIHNRTVHARRNEATIPIFYRLHNGDVIFRQYRVPHDFMTGHNFQQVLLDPLVLSAAFPILRHAEEIQELEINFWTNEVADGEMRSENIREVITNSEHFESIVDAMLQDFVASAHWSAQWNHPESRAFIEEPRSASIWITGRHAHVMPRLLLGLAETGEPPMNITASALPQQWQSATIWFSSAEHTLHMLETLGYFTS